MRRFAVRFESAGITVSRLHCSLDGTTAICGQPIPEGSPPVVIADPHNCCPDCEMQIAGFKIGDC